MTPRRRRVTSTFDEMSAMKGGYIARTPLDRWQLERADVFYIYSNHSHSVSRDRFTCRSTLYYTVSFPIGVHSQIGRRVATFSPGNSENWFPLARPFRARLYEPFADAGKKRRGGATTTPALIVAPYRRDPSKSVSTSFPGSTTTRS